MSEQDDNLNESNIISISTNDVEISITSNDPNLKDILNDSEILVNNKKQTHMTLPSNSKDLNDFQTAWNSFGIRPSTLGLYLTINVDDVWDILSKEYEFYYTDATGDSSIDLTSNSINTRYFVRLDNDLYVQFNEVESKMCYHLEFYYDHTKINHHKFMQGLVDAFTPYRIEEKEEKIEKLYIVDYIENFNFIPKKIEKEKINLDRKKKKVYNDIVKDINGSASNLYLVNGKVNSGKTDYIRKLIQNIKKPIIYVPVLMFESVFHNYMLFKESIEKFGECVIIYEDCEIYFKHTSLYSSILLQENSSLFSESNNVNMLVFNLEDRHVLDVLKNNSKIKTISIDGLDVDTDFLGYK